MRSTRYSSSNLISEDADIACAGLFSDLHNSAVFCTPIEPRLYSHCTPLTYPEKYPYCARKKPCHLENILAAPCQDTYINLPPDTFITRPAARLWQPVALRGVVDTCFIYRFSYTGLRFIESLWVCLKIVYPIFPMVLLIIIPIKWLFHWEYTLFSDKPLSCRCSFLPFASFCCACHSHHAPSCPIQSCINRARGAVAELQPMISHNSCPWDNWTPLDRAGSAIRISVVIGLGLASANQILTGELERSCTYCIPCRCRAPTLLFDLQTKKTSNRFILRPTPPAQSPKGVVPLGPPIQNVRDSQTA